MSNETFKPSTDQELSGDSTSALKEDLKTEVLDELHRQKIQKRKTIFLCLLSIIAGRILYRILVPSIAFAFGLIIGNIPFLSRILASEMHADYSLTLAVFSCLSLSISALPTAFLSQKICGQAAPICIYTICWYILSYILNADTFAAEYIFPYFVAILTFGVILILDIVRRKKCPLSSHEQ